MNASIVPRFAVIVGLLASAPGAAAGAPEEQSERRLDPLRDVGIDQHLGTDLPLGTPFVDSTGRDIVLGDCFEDRPVLVALVYYECPMLCTLVLNGLVKCLNAVPLEVGKDFDIVVISIDPGEDAALAAEKRATYSDSYKRSSSDAGWHFLVGEAASIEAVAKAVGFRYVYDPERDEYAHAAGIVAATPGGRLARYFYGVEFSSRDVRLGLVEAAEGRIGTLADQVLLLCLHYDPETGKYGLAILTTIRIAGSLTLVLLGLAIYRMVRRDRSRGSLAQAVSRHV